ncbi:MAG: hypothetical protein KDC57_18485 [Saprospiraceae bacterium]|nr:hypothetical protein [Saprospiraceae bacterium]
MKIWWVERYEPMEKFPDTSAKWSFGSGPTGSWDYFYPEDDGMITPVRSPCLMFDYTHDFGAQ